MLTDPRNSTCDVRVDESLWRSSMLPEGILQRWLIDDGAKVSAGASLVIVMIEDARHVLIAPASGTLEILAGNNALVEPGSVVGHINGRPARA